MIEYYLKEEIDLGMQINIGSYTFYKSTVIVQTKEYTYTLKTGEITVVLEEIKDSDILVSNNIIKYES